MKNFILTILVTTSLSSYGQWTTSGSNISNTNTGNVGIGTANPSTRLHLFNASTHTYLNIDKPGTAYEGGIQFSNNGSPMFIMWSDNDGTDALRIEAVGLTGENDAAPRIQFPKVNKNIYMAESGGNVGIGTNNPTYKLQVAGGAIALDDDQPIRGGGRWLLSGNQTAVTVGTANPGMNIRLMAGADTERVHINGATGNVGIGTTSPNQKLTVNGTIYGKEVKVDLNVPGPDYVFEKDYKLPSLDEIKSYVDQHKHLPEVPSAKEMEQNGINLSEMNMILLKKVEELTLHVVNQEMKRRGSETMIVELQAQNELLMTMVDELKKDISNLKTKK